jgi:small subunit ribosomal protein S16
MAVALRFTRIGKKKQPFYRIVATDSKKSRDGEALEILGTYNALKSSIVCFNMERVQYWLSVGAQMSDAVNKVYKLAKKNK